MLTPLLPFLDSQELKSAAKARCLFARPAFSFCLFLYLRLFPAKLAAPLNPRNYIWRVWWAQRAGRWSRRSTGFWCLCSWGSPERFWGGGGIHPKGESPGSPDSADYLNFPQNHSLRTRKLPTLLCWILSQGAKAVKICQSVKVENAINVWQTYSWFHPHFSETFFGLYYDLRTFVARFWCRDLRTFSANFSWLKNRLRKLFRF